MKTFNEWSNILNEILSNNFFSFILNLIFFLSLSLENVCIREIPTTNKNFNNSKNYMINY